MICHLLASIPSQGSVKFFRQFVGVFDQPGDNTARVFVGNLNQHDIACLPLNKSGDIAILGSSDQITFPMPWYCAVFDASGPFADRNGILNLA
ncbi:hypothetical protein PsAD26_04744 [Pseudovibrio sp. Ad26]|nr:hypothetical protein PsAD26_04744 [Pseudovibrio sp. Ad26]